MKISSIWGHNVSPNYVGGYGYESISKMQVCGGAVIEIENEQFLTVLIEDYSAGENGSRAFKHIVIVDNGRTMAEAIIDATFDGYDSPVTIWKIASPDELREAYGIDFNQLAYELVKAIREVAVWSWHRNPKIMPAIWTDANVPFAGWDDSFEIKDGAYDLFGKYKVKVKNGIADTIETENGKFVDYAFHFLQKEAIENLEYEPLPLETYIDKLYSYTTRITGCGFFRRRIPDPSGAQYACGIDVENVKSKPMPRH